MTRTTTLLTTTLAALGLSACLFVTESTEEDDGGGSSSGSSSGSGSTGSGSDPCSSFPTQFDGDPGPCNPADFPRAHCGTNSDGYEVSAVCDRDTCTWSINLCHDTRPQCGFCSGGACYQDDAFECNV